MPGQPPNRKDTAAAFFDDDMPGMRSDTSRPARLPPHSSLTLHFVVHPCVSAHVVPQTPAELLAALERFRDDLLVLGGGAGIFAQSEDTTEEEDEEAGGDAAAGAEGDDGNYDEATEILRLHEQLDQADRLADYLLAQADALQARMLETIASSRREREALAAHALIADADGAPADATVAVELVEATAKLTVVGVAPEAAEEVPSASSA